LEKEKGRLVRAAFVVGGSFERLFAAQSFLENANHGSENPESDLPFVGHFNELRWWDGLSVHYVSAGRLDLDTHRSSLR
jgi:hypothetical protein